MSLIPHEMAENMAEKVHFEQRYKEDTRPTPYHAMSIDREMQSILSRPDMSEYAKVVAYNQLLRKYLNVIHSSLNVDGMLDTLVPKKEENQQRKEETSSSEATGSFLKDTSMETSDTTMENPLLGKFLVEGVPGYGKSKARKLIKILEADPKFHWDEKGEISINGKSIKGSNIKDIIHNASSNPRGKNTPIGLDPVLSYLRDNGDISENMIINKNWRKQLNMTQTSQKKADTSTPKRYNRRTPLKNWSSPIPPHSQSHHEWESWN